MQAGKLKDRVTLYGARTGAGEPSWPAIGSAWAGFQEPRSVGRSEQTGIRAVDSTFVRMRYRAGMEHGQLIQRGADWYIVESVEPGQSRSELAISARRIIGQSALYRQRGGASDVSVLAFLTRENIYTGPMNEPRHQIELFQPQLPYPWGRRGDQITIRGATYKVDGVVEGSDDGITLRVMGTL
ncbi:phage head completion protein [Marinobacter xestospongiae]|uniref:phage head completion protein n=1 Tax=Marinobacter xestospongiae TaxID=994319 RepID=UPI002003BF43|nr:hypothetical protein [Marinobacter xestospongiae]MCK7568808.1 hypothetical protein [Marinobacter xestospongiae]